MCMPPLNTKWVTHTYSNSTVFVLFLYETRRILIAEASGFNHIHVGRSGKFLTDNWA